MERPSGPDLCAPDWPNGVPSVALIHAFRCVIDPRNRKKLSPHPNRITAAPPSTPQSGGRVMGIRLKVNGVIHEVDVESNAPLLWVIRDELGLTGTKFGCGIAACGACTVHVNGQAARSCSVMVGSVADAQITTIEGLGASGLNAVQQAWIEHQVPQCGYCQSGMIMAVSAFLASH